MADPLLVIGPITPPMQARLERDYVLHRKAEIADMDTWLTEIGPGVSQVLTDGHFGISPDLIAALPALKMVSCYGVGYDNIDAAACDAQGIMVTHTPNVLNAEVATTAVLLMLACYRELLRDDAWVRSGNWEQIGPAPLTRSAEGQTIGILGMGRIGQEIATRLQPWSPTILYHTRTPKDLPYEFVGDLVEMAQRSDVLIVITPGGTATRHLVDEQVINALGPQGTLINVARGGVVDETALTAALADKRLGWAGLDVFEAEPHVPETLRALSNVTLLPHVGSATVETRAAMGNLAIDNLMQFKSDGSVKTPVPECR